MRDRRASDLEHIIQHRPEHSKLRQWLQPSTSEYDVRGNAKELIKEPTMKELKVTEDEAAYFLAKSLQKNAEMYALAVHGDTIDKVRGLVRKVITYGLSAVLTPFTAGASDIIGAAVYIGVEGYQWRTKGKVMRMLSRSDLPENRGYAEHLRNYELISFLPVVGDAMDFMNTYIKYVTKAITNEGRQMILEKYEPFLQQKYERYENPDHKGSNILEGEFTDIKDEPPKRP